MSPEPDAVLLDAPDQGTTYIKRAVEESLGEMDSGAILEVRYPDVDTGIDLTEWCLSGGIRILNPFEHIELGRLLLENKPAKAGSPPRTQNGVSDRANSNQP